MDLLASQRRQSHRSLAFTTLKAVKVAFTGFALKFEPVLLLLVVNTW